VTGTTGSRRVTSFKTSAPPNILTQHCRKDTEDLAENQRRKSELIASCAAGECVLLVGAGLSMRLGYPGSVGVSSGAALRKPIAVPRSNAIGFCNVNR